MRSQIRRQGPGSEQEIGWNSPAPREPIDLVGGLGVLPERGTLDLMAEIEAPDAAMRLEILRETRHVAVVGVSSNPARASHEVAAYLLDFPEHFSVSLVNPRETEILGRPVVPSLRDLDEPPDLVDVFRRPEHLPAIAEEAVAVGAKTLWLQLGLVNPEAAAIAHCGGLCVVMDRCLKVDHALVRDAL